MKTKPLNPRMNNPPRIAFFGTPDIVVPVADALHHAGYTPQLVITRADKPQGRGRVLTPPPMKVWADAHQIPTMQPVKITDEVIAALQSEPWDLFIVAAYGRLLPQALLDIPAHGTLNVHPSLLPHLRGPSPIRSAILMDEKETGVTIMQLDADMDHGPIVMQETVPIPEWPPHADALERLLFGRGAALLVEAIPRWLDGTLTATEQDHSKATFCKMLKKDDAHISLADDPYQNLLKIRAYEEWPVAYTFFERRGERIRVQIIDAHMAKDGSLSIDTVKPEGKHAMPYAAFLNSGATPVLDK